MKIFIMLLLSMSVVAGGYSGDDTFPGGRTVLDIRELGQIYPGEKFDFKNRVEFYHYKKENFYVVKTKSRTIAVKNKNELDLYYEKSEELTTMIQNFTDLGIPEEEAVLSIKENLNINEVNPFSIEDYL